MVGRVPRSIVVTALLAVLVTAGVLITATMLRPDVAGDLRPGGGEEPAAGGQPSVCGDRACQVLLSIPVRGTTAELLSDPEGRLGHVRFGGLGSDVVVETELAGLGVRVNQESLTCVDGAIAACLVTGPYEGGTLGEVLVAGGDTWRNTGRLYFSDARRVLLTQVTPDPAPEVVVVRHDCTGQPTASGTGGCGKGPVLAEVLGLGGEIVGCTRKFNTVNGLRGWPDVKLTETDLRPC